MRKTTDPYVQIDKRIRASGLSTGAFYLYAVIRETAWKVGSEYFRGTEALADECRVTRQTITAWLNELEAVCAVTIQRNPGPRAHDIITVADPAGLDPEYLVEHRRAVAQKRKASRNEGSTVDTNPAVKPHLFVVKPDDKPEDKRSSRELSNEYDSSSKEDDFKNEENNQEGSPGGRRGRNWFLNNGDVHIRDEVGDEPASRIILRTLERAIGNDPDAGARVIERLRPLVEAYPDVALAVDPVLLEFAGEHSS